MNKIIILHRDDLYGLTRNEPIANIVYESFPDPLLKFLDADFIAYEDDITGLLKILKNNYGTCITISYEHFLMAIDRITQISAMEADFPVDQAMEPIGYFKGMTRLGNMVERPIMRSNIDKINPYPELDNIYALYPEEKREHPADMEMAKLMMEHALAFTRKELTAEEFHSEVENMAQYYGEQIVIDPNYLINEEVGSAIYLSKHRVKQEKESFPVNLCQAILYFNPRFDNIFKVMFQNTEVFFTSTLQISYPELYAEIKKECGFWCQDTDLYKQMVQLGCTHEECMINTLLKAIFRFRRLIKYNQIKSLDHLI